jgi:hypothetical protein
MQTRLSNSNRCRSCVGTGEAPTDYGIVDCPDCGGGGYLPTKNVLVDWLARDIERAVEKGRTPEPTDVRWLLGELRLARAALTEIIALAHDAQDPDDIALRIRFAANRALGVYDVAPHSDAPDEAAHTDVRE